MLKEEYNETRTRVHHYSDIGMMILQHPTEIMYEDAIDKVPCKYTYTETDTPIPDPEEPEVKEE